MLALISEGIYVKRAQRLWGQTVMEALRSCFSIDLDHVFVSFQRRKVSSTIPNVHLPGIEESASVHHVASSFTDASEEDIANT